MSPSWSTLHANALCGLPYFAGNEFMGRGDTYFMTSASLYHDPISLILWKAIYLFLLPDLDDDLQSLE